MTVELSGAAPEVFDSRITTDVVELVGSGRLRRLGIEFGQGWLTPRESSDGVGIDVEHEVGARASVRIRPGRRVRIELTVESIVEDVITVHGPVMWVRGENEPISWHAGATAEIVLPSEHGPGLLTQRRGISTPGGEPGMSYPLDEELSLRPRQAMSAAWTYEAFPGGLLDVPAEPGWLPLVRHVPTGRAVEISAPDGLVQLVGDGTVEDVDGEFEVYPPEGLTAMEVWGPGGRTLVEVGAYEDLAVLRRRLVEEQGSDDVWAYVAARSLAEGPFSDGVLDRIDWALGAYEDEPTAWSVSASLLASHVGLPLTEQAQRGAAEVLSRGGVDDALLLALHGLAPAELLTGGWPIGDFGQRGLEALARLSYGRIHTDGRRERGRDVAVARLYAAGLGETERGLHAAACAQGAEGRLMCLLTTRPDPLDLAWLSVGA